MRVWEHVSFLEGLRLQRGLSQTDVQTLTGLAPRTLRRLERDPSYKPQASTVERLADLYNVPPARLLNELRKHALEVSSDG